MNESETRRLVYEVARLGPRRGVPDALARLSRMPLDSAQVLLPSIVNGLAVRGSPWVAGFQKTIAKGGSCPKALRAALGSALERIQREGVKSSLPAVLRSQRVAVAKRHLVIQSQFETGINFDQRGLIAKLRDLSVFAGPIDVDIRFECDNVYVYGLALLAAWCARYAANVSVSTFDPRLKSYLARIGFLEVVEQQRVIDSPRYDADNHVALTQVLRSKKEDADQLAGRLVELLSRHANLDRDQRSALIVTFAELIENVYRHAQSDFPGYVIAQAHPTPGFLHIVIVDTGIGIHDSFRRSDREEVRQRARSELDSLRLALMPYVTSKAAYHSGYGLYVVSELVARNHGFFRLTSGRRTLFAAPRTPRRRKGPVTQEWDNLPWQGTELALEIRLDSPLPLRDVYDTLTQDTEEFVD